MPLKTGATAQLDAPEAAAVAALIASSPPAPHDLAGAQHVADVLADLNTKITDADLVALAGQIGGTAASPDVRGVRETGGPTLLDLGAIADLQVIARSGVSVLGLTAAQLTAKINAFTSALKGLAPASGGGTLNFLRADGTWAMPVAVFGSEPDSAASDGESATASTTFQEKLSLTTASVPAGTYRVGWMAEATNSDAEKEFAWRFRVAGIIEGQGEDTEKNGDDFFPIGGFKHFVLGSPGTITADIFFSATINGGTAKMRKARIEVWRVS